MVRISSGPWLRPMNRAKGKTPGWLRPPGRCFGGAFASGRLGRVPEGDGGKRLVLVDVRDRPGAEHVLPDLHVAVASGVIGRVAGSGRLVEVAQQGGLEGPQLGVGRDHRALAHARAPGAGELAAGGPIAVVARHVAGCLDAVV